MVTLLIEFSALVAYAGATVLAWFDKNGNYLENIEYRLQVGSWISYSSLGIMVGTTIIVLIYFVFFKKY